MSKTIYANRTVTSTGSSPSSTETTYNFADRDDEFILWYGPSVKPALQVALDELFSDNVTATTNSDCSPDNSTASAIKLYSFNAFSNISMTMNTVAVAMTNYIRDGSNY